MTVHSSPLQQSANLVPDYVVPASVSLQEGRPRTLKHGDTFAVFDHHGDVVADDGAAEGLYHRDTRYLSRLELWLAGMRPILLSSTMRDDNATLTCDLTNPDLYAGPGIVTEHNLVHIRRTKFVFGNVCYERLAVRNFGAAPFRQTLEIRFDADFADLFEVRGRHRPCRGTRHPVQLLPAGAVLSYTGLDATRRTTWLRFDPAPAVMAADRAVFELDLAPGARAVIFVEIQCDDDLSTAAPSESFLRAIWQARRALRYASSRAASVATSNEIFNELLRRSIADLYMLTTDTESGPYPYAGIPWYSTAFGRDALITALETLWLDPEIARGVLSYLAANQAAEVDPYADAEPGKILHEVRHGEMAELGEVPFRRYYGSVDATPLFVMLAGAYLRRTGDLPTIEALWPNIEAAIGWIEQYGDRDGDGFVEYFRMTDKGLANQGWKDSHDSIFHADGSGAPGAIALSEVQGYVMAAFGAGARIAQKLGHLERAIVLQQRAEEMRQRIEAVFWSDAIGTYALALDGQKQPCLVRSSNAGHLLMSGAPSPERAALVAAQLMSSVFFSGWGIRTIATGEARYNPMSYHNGSVWPHDNAMIGIGFKRYGFREEAARILEGLFAACGYIDLRRLPELVCGFPRRRRQGPTSYPVACAPQAWSAASPLSLLESCLGLGFDLQARTVTFDRPVLPRFLDEVILRNLRIGDATINIVLRGSGGAVAMQVLSRSGDIRATMTS